MGDSFKVNLRGLRRLGTGLGDGALTRAISDIPKSKAIAALIAQSVADNFDKEGPGWAPLKGKTLRLTVGKAQLKAAQRAAAYQVGVLKKTKKGTAVDWKKARKTQQVGALHKKVEAILVTEERTTRASIKKTGRGEVGRMILQRTGLLKKCATTPGASGANKNGKSGSNIYRVEGTTIIWGVDLIYARAMNRGVPARNVPARPFLVMRQEWLDKIRMYYMERVITLLRGAGRRV